MMRVMNVNWLGTVIASQVFAADLVGGEGSSIINITSMAAYDALSMVPAYASSKAAVDMFTKWLSNYLSNEFGKVRVNAVAPGITETDMMKAVPKEVLDPLVRQIPLRRLGKPEDIANAFVFLASEEASYITGVVLSVDGMARS